MLSSLLSGLSLAGVNQIPLHNSSAPSHHHASPHSGPCSPPENVLLLVSTLHQQDSDSFWLKLKPKRGKTIVADLETHLLKVIILTFSRWSSSWGTNRDHMLSYLLAYITRIISRLNHVLNIARFCFIYLVLFTILIYVHVNKATNVAL